MSWQGNGRPCFAVVPGDGRNQGFSRLKAGPAEVLLSAGNVPARGQQVTTGAGKP
jgi:hypothetical protein